MSHFFSSLLKHSKDEDVSKYKDRVVLVESHLKELARVCEKYAKTTEKLSRRGLAISDAILSTSKEGDETMSVLENVSTSLAALNDQRQKFSINLKSRIAGEFRVNETKCKETKKEIDLCMRLIEKEYREKEQFLKQQSKVPIDRAKVMETKIRLEKAQEHSKNSKQLLGEQMEEFEIQKRNDIARILRDFIDLEMKLHARCLEIYTDAYQQLKSIPDTINVSRVYSIVNKQSENNVHDALFHKSSKLNDSHLSLKDLE